MPNILPSEFTHRQYVKRTKATSFTANRRVLISRLGEARKHVCKRLFSRTKQRSTTPGLKPQTDCRVLPTTTPQRQETKTAFVLSLKSPADRTKIIGYAGRGATPT
ncbi:hypothetical protein ElyMa_006055800 [Elysia marginata]|uniref:Uncharacterized protein n=1 Tax=Elysia marginata TaxID=1093978 RepID=A0AAV4GLF1_9GAST|nr:hypothetical protein ElyMa_006055800 [Elysia marginata]